MRILIVDDEWMVLEDTKEIIEKVRPEAEISCADNYIDALKIAEEQQIDVVILDIEMPGMNGIELGRRFKQIYSKINIIFVTAYKQYAVEAFSIYASGYLIKPIEQAEVEEAFANLRNSLKNNQKKLKIQCFGKFEVFYEGFPIRFERIKAKEIFAYLVDLKGAAANTGELCAVLWEDLEVEADKKNYFRVLISDLKKALRECDAEDVFINTRNQFSIDVKKVDCDYYNYLNNDPKAIKSYNGEYMKQYSWAEFSFKGIL